MRLPVFVVLMTLVMATPVQAESTITYQGQLQQSGGPVSGTVNLEFRLYDAPELGNQVGDSQERPDWPVTDGLFQVELDFGTNAFDGGKRWLEIEVAGQTLEPRQPVTPAPSALHAFNVPADNLAGDFWRRGGNAGTDPLTDFIGATDDQDFHIRVWNVPVLRLEPSSETFEGLPVTANIIAGSHANHVDVGVRGATIAGGGAKGDPFLPHVIGRNRVDGHYGTVGGGMGNEARSWATVAGGLANIASFSQATVGGGIDNTASAVSSTVAGGETNIASGPQSTVGGGGSNTASDSHSTIGGGQGNTAGSSWSTVGGGLTNTASWFATTVGGGEGNQATGDSATVGGGVGNTASGIASTVPGGDRNQADGDFSFAAGRRAKAVHDGAFVWADNTLADFASTDEDQFLVRATGGVGINTNSPSAAVTIRASADQLAPLRAQNADGDNLLTLLATGALSISGSVFVGDFGTSTSTTVCRTAQGRLAACTSSRRYKKEFSPLESASELVGRLQPLRYRWKETDEPDIGLIAEDVAEVVPEMVRFDEDGNVESFESNRLGPILVGAFNEQSEKNNRRFAAMERENLALRAEVAVLKVQASQMRELAERNSELEERLAILEAALLVDEVLAGGSKVQDPGQAQRR
jgi:hypothetical protein